MADRLRPTSGKEALRKLSRAGFGVVRVKGSAHYLKNPTTGRWTSIHLHAGRDIPVSLLRKIVVHQAGLSVEEWNRL